MVQHITFRQLRTLMADRIGKHGLPAASSLANLQSALSRFLGERSLSESSVAGSTLRANFPGVCEEHIAALRQQGRSDTYCRNRRHYLQPWTLLVRALDHECAVVDGVITPLQSAIRTALRNRSVRAVARQIGIRRDTLRHWLHGGVPRLDKLDVLRRFEIVCELPEGQVTDLLPYKARAAAEKESRPSIKWRKENGKRVADPYCLSVDKAPAVLREEYCSLFRYKSSYPIARDTGRARFRDLIAVEDDAVGKTWRLTAPDPNECLEGRWHDVLNGQRCETASITWRMLASFFGWAIMPSTTGGAGIAAEDLTLAMLTETSLVESYIDWHTEQRVRGINQGHLTFLSKAMMLCHPESGFLLKRPDIGERRGFKTSASWVLHCKDAHAKLRAIVRKIKPHVVATRPPEEPLETALQLEQPLAPFVKGVQSYESNRCFSSKTDEALWARDLLLMSLLMSNPLRRRNLMELTYRGDNSGNLRKTSAGEWRIFIPRRKFKNADNGAAKDRDYDQPIEADVWHFIEQYIEIREHLTSSDLVFVSSAFPGRTWRGVTNRFRDLTASYVDGCPGVGVQAMRHLVATHIIINSRGDYEFAARILHDRPETVRKHYAHLLEAFEDRGRAKYLAPALRGLRRKSSLQLVSTTSSESDSEGGL